MSANYIQINALDDSGSFKGYLALPPTGKGPGLVMAQEIFGINDNMRELADTYAQQGYVVLVPDLFWRQEPNVELSYTPADWQKAFEYYQGFNEAKGVDDIQAAINTLRQHSSVENNKVGVIGYCLGGKLAYLAACRTDSDVSVAYYGVGIEAALNEADKIKAPLLAHIAELDQFCPPEAREKIVAALGQNAKVDAYVYAGVDHAFARPNGDHYDEAAASKANERSLASLKSAIGPY